MPDAILVLLGGSESCLLQAMIHHVTAKVDKSLAKHILQRVFHARHPCRCRHHFVRLMKAHHHIVFATAIGNHRFHLLHQFNGITESPVLSNEEDIAPSPAQLSHRLSMDDAPLAEGIRLGYRLLGREKVVKLALKLLIRVLPELGLGLQRYHLTIDAHRVYPGTSIHPESTLQERMYLALMVKGRDERRDVIITDKGIKLAFLIIEEHHIVGQDHRISPLSSHDGKRTFTTHAAVDDIVSIAQEVLQHPWVAVIALNNLLEELLDAIASHIGMASGQGIAPAHYHFLLLVIRTR